MIFWISIFAYISAKATGYYLPGVSPNSFEEGDDVPLYVSKVTSTQTQMPYDYYSLPYCKPKVAGLQSENIGEALSGDRIENSVYKVFVCHKLYFSNIFHCI